MPSLCGETHDGELAGLMWSGGLRMDTPEVSGDFQRLAASQAPPRAPGAWTHEDRLATLIAKAFEGQWSPETVIDWDQRISLPRYFPRKGYVSIVSQLYHGELAALALCRRLQMELPNPRARQFLSTQVGDEARHARVYESYLMRLGDVAPANVALSAALERAISWHGSHQALIIAIHLVLEGEALRLQQGFGKWFPCPLLRQIHALISCDEARHVAFGKIYPWNTLSALSAEERIVMYRWVRELWHDCASAARCEYYGLGSLITRVGRGSVGERWSAQVEVLKDIGLVTDDEASRA